MRADSPSPEAFAKALERDSAWLHGLARALTRDAEAAADAAQVTLMKAWEDPPRSVDETRPRRAWLARVLGNVVREAARSAGMRRGRERRVARPEASQPENSALERLELQRQVVEAMQGLDEPYRSTLVARYLDGQSVRSIASRAGVPPKTVYTRIERGLERMRSRLDRQFGGNRSAWMGAVLALPVPGGLRWTWMGPQLLGGAGVMAAGTKIVVGGAALALGVWALWPSGKDPVQAESQARGAVMEEPRRSESDAPAPRVSEREVLVLPTPTEGKGSGEVEPAPPLEDLATVILGGRVLDVLGEPVVGVQVVPDQGSGRVRTDALGRFQLPCDGPLPARLRLDSEDWAAVREGHVSRRRSLDAHLIVAAPAGRVDGRVVDEQGLALPGVRLSLVHAEALLVDFPEVLDHTLGTRPKVDTDDQGRFSLERAPLPVGSRLRAQKSAYETLELPLDAAPREDLVLELRALVGEERKPMIEGLVLLPGGRPAVGARVSFDSSSTTTGDDGRFELPLAAGPAPAQPLAAGLAGYGTAILERFGELQQQAAPHAPASVVLRLKERSLSITGRIVDARGQGLDGWGVRLGKGTELSRYTTPPILVEELSGSWREVRADEEGRFELGGLLDRRYDLVAYHLESLVSVPSEAVQAGDSVVFQVPDEAVHPRVAGRVVSRGGDPVEGVRVSLRRIVHRMQDEGNSGFSWVTGRTVSTDADGRFELVDVAREGVDLHLEGPQVVPEAFPLEDLGDPGDVELAVALRMHFRAEVEGEDFEGLGIEVRNRADQPLPIITFTPSGSTSNTRHRLTEGKMQVSAVSEEATSIVLLRRSGRERVELDRQDLSLVPGEVTEVRFRLP